MDDWIVPDWPAPKSIRAVITTRTGGCSRPPFDSLNLADHVDDDPACVEKNRAALAHVLGLSSEPMWLQQVHGCAVAETVDGSCRQSADASTSTLPGEVCVVMTADCLPLLLCDRSGTRVAAVHAGWRGLADGVIEAAIAKFNEDGEELLAWLGPAIGPERFEVGSEVRERFLALNPADEAAFVAQAGGKWLADIYALARNRLQRLNCGYVGGGDYCTVSERERFFSYRRDGVTGRMASLIWIE
jgi:polyphenol oxidase